MNKVLRNQQPSVSIDIPVIILAGGQGTRLRAQLPNIPKLLAPVGSGSFLDFILAWLNKQKVKICIFSLGHQSEQIIEALAEVNGRYEMEISYVVESSPLGTLGGLSHTINEQNVNECLVLNGDTFIDTNLQDFLLDQLNKNSYMGIISTQVEDTSRYGSVVFKDDFFVKSFVEKNIDISCKGWINAGIYYFSTMASKQIKSCNNGSIEYDFLSKKLDKLSYFKVEETTFIDIGTTESYCQVEQVLKEFL